MLTLWRPSWTFYGLLVCLCGLLSGVQPINLYAQSDNIRSERLGITHINGVGGFADDARYQDALRIGAGWTRWPLYWDLVERSPGNFDWAGYDRLVADDVRYGLQMNAILLNRPNFYGNAATAINGLYDPVFTDGTDTRGGGKGINPNNYWAVFVYQAVSRYKPGGTFPNQQGWGASAGIRVWEVWNEPDFDMFWRDGVDNYARLLKVAYLAAKHADPNALVMFGGLLYPDANQNWLGQVLTILAEDPQRSANNWYFDAVGVHSYNYPYRTGWLVRFTRQTLQQFGLNRPIWVNETGVRVWNDYPGPVWASTAGERRQRSTMQQQAWYIIQNAAYAFSEGAETVFHHQLYDDCGDSPGDFPAHSGDFCATGQMCFGDAFGLYRNPRGAACFSQHPYPGTPRPSANAFRMLAETFGTQPFNGGTITRADTYIIIRFDRPATGQRITVAWNRTLSPIQVPFQAIGEGALLYTLQGRQLITAQNGRYPLELKPAVQDYYLDLEAGDITGIGGEPIILIETPNGTPSPDVTIIRESILGDGQQTVQQPQAANGDVFDASSPSINPNIPAPPTLTPTITPIPVYPTTAPLLPISSGADVPTMAAPRDITPPTASLIPLPVVSPPSFTVRWSGQDDTAIDKYLVWVQVDGGEWLPWLETARTEAIYTGESGRIYNFAVWAVDVAGNWSQNIDLVPQATTRIE